MAPKSSRRDFLRGQRVGRTVADALHRAGPSGDTSDRRPPPTPAAAYVVHVSRRAMACEFEIYLNAGQYPHGLDAALEALDLVEALEEQMSVFRPTSEVNRLNRTAAEGPIAVASGLFGVLELADRIHAQTGGAFDITAGPLWDAWGFSRRQGCVPSDAELAAARDRVGWGSVRLDPVAKTVQFLKAGMGLNLGSIGKGHAVDRCGEALQAAGIDDFLIHGGQSSVLARGQRMAGSDSEGPGWTVGIRHPLKPDRRLGEVRLCDRALATSGSGVQFFRHKGRRLGHIIDPRTGRPAEGVLSVTVMAPTAAEADALATGLYVLGVERGLEFCRERPDLAALYVLPARRAGGLEIHCAGLDENHWKPLSDAGRRTTDE